MTLRFIPAFPFLIRLSHFLFDSNAFLAVSSFYFPFITSLISCMHHSPIPISVLLILVPAGLRPLSLTLGLVSLLVTLLPSLVY